MRASLAAILLVFGMASAASAQLAPLESGGAPASAEGLAALGSAGTAQPSDAARAVVESERACREQARAFRYRNTQSPAERRQALSACLAAVLQRERIEVAGP
jgi:hypothetical protein